MVMQITDAAFVNTHSTTLFPACLGTLQYEKGSQDNILTVRPPLDRSEPRAGGPSAVFRTQAAGDHQAASLRRGGGHVVGEIRLYHRSDRNCRGTSSCWKLVVNNSRAMWYF